MGFSRFSPRTENTARRVSSRHYCDVNELRTSVPIPPHSFWVSPCTYILLKPLLICPATTTPLSCFFGYLFVYLHLVSVYFTHRNITFCLPPSVIIQCYVTRVYKNVFYLTRTTVNFCIPRFCFSPTWYIFVNQTFRVMTFYYPIIWRSYFLCTLPLSTRYHLIFVSHLVGLAVGALKGNLVVMIS